MRTPTIAGAVVATALAVAVACSGGGPKQPAEPAPSPTPDAAAVAPDPGTGAGSSVDLGSDLTTGIGSNAAGSAAGSDAGAGSGSGTVVADGKDWFHGLSRDEQMAVMKDQVVPVMAAEFQKFDAKEFKKFDCKTCHGKGATTKKFEMPNPDLPKLDFAALEKGKHKRAAEFMAQIVVPKMAEILKTKPYTPEDPTGFGCLHCHLQKK